jgi:predicted MFS family arabinose efflux permease
MGRVFAMALGAFVLVASEFMPVSLLTPVAADLHISEGQAGRRSRCPARSRW